MRFLRHLRDFVTELFAFAKSEQAWWIVPIVLLLLLVGAVIVVVSGASPFIYSLF